MREARSARGKVAKRERADAVMHANEIAERLRGGRKLARPRNGAVHENFVALSRADMATSPRALMKTVGSDDIHDDIDMAGRACATEPVATVSVVWCRAPPRISSAKTPVRREQRRCSCENLLPKGTLVVPSLSPTGDLT